VTTAPDASSRAPTLGDIAGFLGIDPPEGELPAGSWADVVVTGIAQDSRVVEPGDLYLARSGRATHGAGHAAAARAAGAVGAVTDLEGAARCRAAGLVTLVVADPVRVAGPLAQFALGQPATRLRTIGVTGTNGKTTTAFMVAALLAAAGHPCGLVGTVLNRVGGVEEASARSTPEATDLARLMARMVAAGDEACVLEVSSHALAQNRVDGIVFDVAVFLNLSQDHLDLHGTMESYFAAKASLFTPERAVHAVVDTTGAAGRRLAEQVTIDLVRLDTGIGGSVATSATDTEPAEADYVLADVSVGPASSSARLVGPGLPPDGLSFTLPMPGDFNLANAAAALLAVHVAGVDVVSAVDGLRTLRVPGHMERHEVPGGVVAVVDFAHTPAAIGAELQALRAGLAPGSGRLIAVAGCGGERDPDKRRPMGEALGSGADVVVITDDNPRHEDPAAIRATALAGARAADHVDVLEVADRGLAIETALNLARRGDVVAVLGKGHETGQEVAGVVHPFSDGACIDDWSRRHQPGEDRA
jgi:UDP-N-acetylmuramoyl-L-alanyl-D-glutamate--2,6-diaminopimelate ligase